MWERSGHTERGRDGCRVPLPWSVSGPSLGFGTGGSWLPQPLDWAKLSVEAQSDDQDSMLSFYRTALRVRREHPVLGAGDGVTRSEERRVGKEGGARASRGTA